MLNGYSFEENPNARPAVVDGEVVWLPTLVGLLNGESGTAPVPKRDLRSVLTAAAAAAAAFERLDAQLAEGLDLAHVIEMDTWTRDAG